MCDKGVGGAVLGATHLRMPACKHAAAQPAASGSATQHLRWLEQHLVVVVPRLQLLTALQSVRGARPPTARW